MDEIQIIQKVQQGDMGAFEVLFDSYKAQAIRTVYLMTGDAYITEDIVQETFATCYLSIKSLKSPEYFKTWFFKSLTRNTWRIMKKQKNLMPIEKISELVECAYLQTNSSNNEFDHVGEKDFVYSQVLKLDYKLQTTIILYYYNELTIKEIAKVMGCLEGTVKSRLYTARKQLKRYFEQQQEVDQSKEVYGL